MKNTIPEVSVITPLFNAFDFLPRLIESVKSQTGASFEHIVVNDCSTDQSLVLLEGLVQGDPRFVVINLEKNLGTTGARNEAIKYARGRYLAFLDADDLWAPNKLECQTKFMHENEAALSFTDYRFMSEDGTKIGRLLRGPRRIGWVGHHMTRYLGCLSVMIDRERCPNFEFPDVPRDDPVEDFLAWSLIIKQTGPAYRCPFDLARYAVVNNSRSRNPILMAKCVWRLYRERENIALIPATFYFSAYIFFTLFKRHYYRPIYTNNGLLGKYK